MDTKEAKVQLPAYLVGDLSPKEAAILEGHLDVNPEAKAAKEQMARQLLPVINLPAPEVGQVALAKLFMDARRELVQPQYQPATAWREGWYFFRAVAAVVVVALILGLVIYGVVPKGSEIVGDMLTATGVRVVRYGQQIETPQGVPLTIKLRHSGARVDLDGSAAVSIKREGKEAQVQVLRGRAIVGAGSEPIEVLCGESKIRVEKLSVAAIDYDTPYERIDGAVIELQRQPISHVARVAEKQFGGLIDDSKLPEVVAKRRISLYGVGLKREEFLASFKAATERYGVSFKQEGKNYVLSYKDGTPGTATDESESVLKVAPLEGTVVFKSEDGEEQKLYQKGAATRDNVLVFAGGMKPDVKSGDDGAIKAQRMVVWAGRTDLPNFKPDQTVANYISMGQSGGKVITVASALPTGTVLIGDSLRYKGNVVRVGETIQLDLPGAKEGRLVGVMSSGIEVSAANDARYFLPVR